MATKTTRKTAAAVTTEQELSVLQEKHDHLVNTVGSFIKGVDTLFKANPSKTELGSNLARYIAELEKSVKF